MTFTAKSDILIAKFDTSGAELISLRDYNDTEYIWQANPAVWARHAPILFPFICNTKSGSYTVGGKQYALKNHGFARDREWEMLRAKEDSLTFLLRSDNETKKLYPFDFELTATYTIRADTLINRITVTNTGDENMPFFLGGHPAFAVPLTSAGKYTDWFVTYGGAENRRLDLSHEAFENDVILRENPEEGLITLQSTTSDARIKLTFDKNGAIAVWSSYFKDDPAKTDNAKFVCLEPWTAPPVYTEDTEELLDMKQTVKLAPGKSYEFAFNITIEC
ncbi:MAG: aldose 1-epimerase family protein [Ruminococcus sp.]|nr:aldose 1-epimerase family protein [Ruminococcus sp.]